MTGLMKSSHDGRNENPPQSKERTLRGGYIGKVGRWCPIEQSAVMRYVVAVAVVKMDGDCW